MLSPHSRLCLVYLGLYNLLSLEHQGYPAKMDSLAHPDLLAGLAPKECLAQPGLLVGPAPRECPAQSVLMAGLVLMAPSAQSAQTADPSADTGTLHWAPTKRLPSSCPIL